MDTSLIRQNIRNAIKNKRIVVVKHFREDEVLPVETRMIPLDIIQEVRGIAKQQAYFIGFEVEFIPGPLEEKDFQKLVIESITVVRITAKNFDPAKPTKLYRMMKRTPTVGWNIRRDW
ncbi:MAG: hypothetical protein HQ591_08160 [candidate division Zixibacteria bacterium]|nr:hypothetical protein [Candidatus Tariuqbacter arcticus]